MLRKDGSVYYADLILNVFEAAGRKLIVSIARDATRDLQLKVWNVLSFFVTYARIDAFEPAAQPPLPAERPSSSPTLPGKNLTQSSPQMDRRSLTPPATMAIVIFL